MIYIGTSITRNMLDYGTSYLDSLSLHSKYSNFVICCGFKADDLGLRTRYPKINFIDVDINSIKTRAKNGWPANRDGFLTLQSGEFIEYLDVQSDDVVIFTDYDITIQREPTEAEIEMFENIGDEEFLMQWDSYPTSKLSEYFPALAAKKSHAEWESRFGVDLSKMLAYNTGVIVARANAYKTLWASFQVMYDTMTEFFTRHAAVQFIDCYVIQKDMKATKMPDDMHNGQWFTGNPCRFTEGYMTVNSEKVLFAHHKFKVHCRY